MSAPNTPSHRTVGIARWLGIGILVGMLALSLLRSTAHAQPPDSPTLTLSESRIYTLEEITHLIREQGKTEIYVDATQQKRRIFLSEGVYPASELIEALSQATGLPIRPEKNARFLIPRDLKFGVKFVYPILPQTTLNRLGKALRPIGAQADLPGQGIPFDASQFVNHQVVTFSALTPAQRSFLVDLEGAQPADAQFQLGSSYLLSCVIYDPPAVKGGPNSVVELNTHQIYYDYRDRLLKGVTIPEK